MEPSCIDSHHDRSRPRLRLPRPRRPAADRQGRRHGRRLRRRQPTIFGSSGAGNFLTRLTTGAAIVFMADVARAHLRRHARRPLDDHAGDAARRVRARRTRRRRRRRRRSAAARRQRAAGYGRGTPRRCRRTGGRARSRHAAHRARAGAQRPHPPHAYATRARERASRSARLSTVRAPDGNPRALSREDGGMADALV